MRPSRTYAVLIGIDTYAAGPQWALPGAATDSFRWARWLMGRGVPEENIRVLVSTERDAASAGWNGQVEPADRETVQRILLHEVPRLDGDLFWLGWSGHGFLDGRDTRRMFYADTRQNDSRNLDLDSLLRTYRTDLVRQFPRQAFFIDACQTYLAGTGIDPTLAEEIFSSGVPQPEREQFVLIAGRPGDEARDLGRRRGGRFSEEVLLNLDRTDHQVWPPDLDRLATELRDRFDTLSADGRAREAPIYLWYRSFLGNEGLLHRIYPKIHATQGNERRIPNISLDKVSEVVEALTAIPAFFDPAVRATIFGLLRTGATQRILDSLPRHNSARAEAVSIAIHLRHSTAAILEFVEAIGLFADTEEQLTRLRDAATAMTKPE